MQPNVTIVLPVYNVEPYLRQCLDSVVNQTMREIQIICINDGSTDGSPAILEEYAAKDSRIIVIHQENSGGGSARNAAFPHIQGKYTYFVDPDDWIDLLLCEKLFKCAEENHAEVVYLGWVIVRETTRGTISARRAPGFKNAVSAMSLPLEKRKQQLTSLGWTCCKFWLSDFLVKNLITFSEGKRPFNDTFQNWKGVVLAEKFAVLEEYLYYYRLRLGSYQLKHDDSRIPVIFLVYEEIKQFLQQTGHYDEYRDVYLDSAINTILVNGYFECASSQSRRKLLEQALERFGSEERSYANTSLGFRLAPGIINLRRVFALKDKRYLRYCFYSVLFRLRCLPVTFKSLIKKAFFRPF